jgi:hypothetical protein
MRQAEHQSVPLSSGNVLDKISKDLFIEFMSREQADPESVLLDIVNDMIDNRKYRAYTMSEEWVPFFTAMQKITKQICKKQGRLEKENKEVKGK